MTNWSTTTTTNDNNNNDNNNNDNNNNNNIDNNNDNNNDNSNPRSNGNASALNALMVQNMQIKQQLATQYDDTVAIINDFKTEVKSAINIMNNNVKRICIQPPRMATLAQRGHNNDAEDAQIAFLEHQVLPKNAELCPRPNSLHELWLEFQFGIGGRKAAKDFTPNERGGATKYKYFKRNFFWDLIVLHI